MEIIDTHLHIWDLDKFSLPWLDDEGEILNRTYLLEDYKKSLGENYQISKAVYVEVDSAQDQKDKENEYIIDVKCPIPFFSSCQKPSLARYSNGTLIFPTGIPGNRMDQICLKTGASIFLSKTFCVIIAFSKHHINVKHKIGLCIDGPALY